MNDRLISHGAFLKKSFLVATGSFLLAHLSAFGSLLSAGVDLGAAGRTQDWAVFTLGTGCGSQSEISGSASVEGNVGVAGSGSLSLRGQATIGGNLSLRDIRALSVSGRAEILGGTFFNNSTKTVLNEGALDAEDASRTAFSLSMSAGYPKNIFANQSLTLSGSGVVVLKLSDFVLGGNAALTLQGNQSTTFVINVKEQFSMSGSSKIKLSGGLTWDNVLFNIRGRGTVSLSGSSLLDGIILATDRTVTLTGNSQVRGEIIANSVVLTGNAVVSRPPTVSP